MKRCAATIKGHADINVNTSCYGEARHASDPSHIDNITTTHCWHHVNHQEIRRGRIWEHVETESLDDDGIKTMLRNCVADDATCCVQCAVLQCICKRFMSQRLHNNSTAAQNGGCGWVGDWMDGWGRVENGDERRQAVKRETENALQRSRVTTMTSQLG